MHHIPLQPLRENQQLHCPDLLCAVHHNRNVVTYEPISGFYEMLQHFICMISLIAGGWTDQNAK